MCIRDRVWGSIGRNRIKPDIQDKDKEQVFVPALFAHSNGWHNGRTYIHTHCLRKITSLSYFNRFSTRKAIFNEKDVAFLQNKFIIVSK